MRSISPGLSLVEYFPIQVFFFRSDDSLPFVPDDFSSFVSEDDESLFRNGLPENMDSFADNNYDCKAGS